MQQGWVFGSWGMEICSGTGRGSPLPVPMGGTAPWMVGLLFSAARATILLDGSPACFNKSPDGSGVLLVPFIPLQTSQ